MFNHAANFANVAHSLYITLIRIGTEKLLTVIDRSAITAEPALAEHEIHLDFPVWAHTVCITAP